MKIILYLFYLQIYKINDFKRFGILILTRTNFMQIQESKNLLPKKYRLDEYSLDLIIQQKQKIYKFQMERKKQKLGRILNTINYSDSYKKQNKLIDLQPLKSSINNNKSNIEKIRSYNKIQSFLNTPVTMEDQIQYSNMKAYNFIQKGKLINNPIITDQVCKIIEKHQSPDLYKNITFTQIKEQKSQKQFKLIGFERRQILQLSKWVDFKMNALKNLGRIQLFDLVEYRQYVVNLALGKILDKVSNISNEMSDLLSELWNKTFFFFQFLLELLLNSKSKMQHQLQELKLNIQKIHVQYLDKLKQQNENEIKNSQVLKTHFKNAIINNKELKKQIALNKIKLQQQKSKSECFQQALIKSIHLNMQFGNGQVIKWANIVLKSILNNKKQQQIPNYKKLKYTQYIKIKAQQAISLYLKQIKTIEALQDQQITTKYLNMYTVEDEPQNNTFSQNYNKQKQKSYNLRNSANIQKQLTVKQILEMYVPKTIATSTEDLIIYIDKEIQQKEQCTEIGINTQNSLKDKSMQTQVTYQNKETNTQLKCFKKNNGNKKYIQKVKQQKKNFQKNKSLQDEEDNHQQIQKHEQNFLQQQFEIKPIKIKLNVQQIQNPAKININQISSIRQMRDYNNSIITQQTINQKQFKRSASFKFFVQKPSSILLTPLQNKMFKNIYITRKSAFFKCPQEFTTKIINNRSFTQIKQIEVESYQQVVKKKQQRRSRALNIKKTNRVMISQIICQNINKLNKNLHLNKNTEVNECIWSKIHSKIKNNLVIPKNSQKVGLYLGKLFSTTIYQQLKTLQISKIKQKNKQSNKKKQNKKHILPLKYIIMNKLFNRFGLRKQNEHSIQILMNNLITLKHFKQLQIFTVLTGLNQGCCQVGANQFDLYLRTYFYLDLNSNYRIENQIKTNIFIINEKIQQICEGYFNRDQISQILYRIQKQESNQLTIEQVSKIIIKKSIEKKKGTYNQFQYFFDVMKKPTQQDLYYFIKHLSINLSSKIKMLKQFNNYVDCQCQKLKWISYQKFWTFCTNNSFPNKNILAQYYKKQANKLKYIKNFILKSYQKIIQLFIKNNAKIPSIIIKIKNYLDTKPSSKKAQFWINFLIVFTHCQLLDSKVQKLINQNLLLLSADYISLQISNPLKALI